MNNTPGHVGYVAIIDGEVKWLNEHSLTFEGEDK